MKSEIKTKTQNALYFNVDLPAYLKEMQMLSPEGCSYILGVPMAVVATKLTQIAQRASELDDPMLNILMLETKLYEVVHSELNDLIKKQKERL